MILFNSLKFLNSTLGFKISLASPVVIIKWSWRKINNIIFSGLVSEPYTINFKTGAPKNNGLFCERIFGPLISWQCKCGFFNFNEPIEYSCLCPLCLSENTTSQVRRYRMGYVYFYTPIAHIWYLYELVPYLLNLPLKILEYLIYYKYITENEEQINVVTLSSKKITNVSLIFASNYIQQQLQQLNLLNESLNYRLKLNTNITFLKKKQYIKTINILNMCLLNNIHPQWIMLDVLPIIPAGLRPLLKIENTLFMSSPLNNVYRNILVKNNRLKKWQILRRKFPIAFEIIEKRNLQKAVNLVLQNNLKKEKNITISSNLQGKYNHFRQYILGKRVDFSGRSVIVSGPELTFNKIGLSTTLGIELFKPILLNILKNNPYISTILRASYFIEYGPLLLKRLLKFILNKEVLMLNRAPTLHRMNIQTFKPYLIENEILKLFPLACSGFNADFDGDQMGLFLILSRAAKKEAKSNIIFDKNLFSPSSSKNIFKYSQASVLGLNTLLSLKGYHSKNLIFNRIEDALTAYTHSLLKLDTVFLLGLTLKSYFNQHIYKKYFLTSVGRLLLQKLI